MSYSEDLARVMKKASDNAPPPAPERYIHTRLRKSRGFVTAQPDRELIALRRAEARARVAKAEAEAAAASAAVLKAAPAPAPAPAPQVINVHVPPQKATPTRVVQRDSRGLVVESVTFPVDDD